MESPVIYEYKIKKFIVYMVRLLCLTYIVLLLIFYGLNSIGSSFFLIVGLAALFLSSTKRIEVHRDFIKICIGRFLSFMDKELLIKYADIYRLEFKEKKANPIAIVLPGFSNIKDEEIEIYYKNNVSKKQTFYGGKAMIKELYESIKKRISESKTD